MITTLKELLQEKDPALEILLGYRSPSEIPAELQRGCVLALLQSTYDINNQSISETATLQAVYFQAGTYEDIEAFKEMAEELFFYVTLRSTYTLEKIEFAYNDIYLFAVATFSFRRKI